MTAYIIEPDPYKAVEIENGLASIGINVNTYADRFAAIRAIAKSKRDTIHPQVNSILRSAKRISSLTINDSTDDLSGSNLSIEI